jgi:hypothetical protein
LESLLCVLPVTLPDAELIAVGEFNTLLRKPPGLDKLVPIDTGDLPPGALLRVYGNNDAGWVVAQQRANEVIFYHSKKLSAGTWKELRREDVTWSYWTGGGQFFMWKTASGFAYVSANGPFRFYEEATGVWSEQPVPNNAKVSYVSENPNGGIGLLTSPGGGLGGIFGTVWYSADQAKTWKMINVPYKIKSYPVQLTNDGAMLAAGGVNSQEELQISHDQGLTWTHHAKYDLRRRFVILKNGDMVDVTEPAAGLTSLRGMFSIRISKDGGKTWQFEYDN